jgi:hypothetical protein
MIVYLTALCVLVALVAGVLALAAFVLQKVTGLPWS